MLLVEYYRAAPDLVQFHQYWCPDTTMMDKIKVGGVRGFKYPAVGGMTDALPHRVL